MTTEKQTHAMTLMRVMAAVTALLPFVRFFMRSSAALWVFYIVLGIMCVATIIELVKYPAGLRTSRLTICFLAICAISICFSLHWRQFMAWQRLGAFILLLFAVGPVVQTRFISRMKRLDMLAMCAILQRAVCIHDSALLLVAVALFVGV